MIAIRSNFFYTRSVPCELWFLNCAKPQEYRDKVLMIDARNIYRKVTRKIYDFSPEQLQNILAIIWLYRGQNTRFHDLVSSYLLQVIEEATRCCRAEITSNGGQPTLSDYKEVICALLRTVQPFLSTLPVEAPHRENLEQLEHGITIFAEDIQTFGSNLAASPVSQLGVTPEMRDLLARVEHLTVLAEMSRDLVKQADLLYKLACRLIDICESELDARESSLWTSREVIRARKAADAARQAIVDQPKKVRYFHRQAVWLVERFPNGKLRDVEGLVKLVGKDELDANDWSLTPGRYVGVGREEQDESFDFEEALRDIHIEIEGLNAEAIQLATQISKNFQEMGI